MKVSVLSAVFNEAEYLEEMLSSLCVQDHANWEVLFADDGSTDRTVELIQSWASAESRVKLVHQGEKIGKVAAFNRAYEASSGEVVVLLAGDDRLPPHSLSMRVSSLMSGMERGRRGAAYFKLQSFSLDPRFNGMTLPRGNSVSHSGGVITMTRALADEVFPIDASLVSEDLWISQIAEDRAEYVIKRPVVVLEYRIHGGNSNPRHRSFDQMSRAMAERHRAWDVLLQSPRLQLSAGRRDRLRQLSKAESLRAEGRVLALLFEPRLSLVDRMAYAAMASPWLFIVRTRLYRVLSGLRGQ